MPSCHTLITIASTRILFPLSKSERSFVQSTVTYRTWSVLQAPRFPGFAFDRLSTGSYARRLFRLCREVRFTLAVAQTCRALSSLSSFSFVPAPGLYTAVHLVQPVNRESNTSSMNLMEGLHNDLFVLLSTRGLSRKR